ncbi:hypothetical protein [Actinorugispora endophytica]|nr:hypothetical protein [Actinorugispora endophytica]
MVSTDRKRRGVPVRAVRRSANPLLARLLTLGGLTVAGWLLAGVGTAFADDAFPTEPRAETSAVAEELERIAEDTADLSRVGGVLDESPRDAGDLVSETVETGGRIGAYTESSLVGEEKPLAEGVPGGLARPAGEIADGLRGTVWNTPGLRRTPDPDAAAPLGPPPAPTATERSSAGEDGGDAVARAGHEVPSRRSAHLPGVPDGLFLRSAGAPANADRSPAGDAAHAGDPSEAPAAPSGKPWRPGADSAGTVSPSSAPSPTAGYLAHRVETPRLVAGGAALSGGPAPAARDAADDPSFSPD